MQLLDNSSNFNFLNFIELSDNFARDDLCYLCNYSTYKNDSLLVLKEFNAKIYVPLR